MLIAVTGGFACGKTTVARLLARRGARRVDADSIAKQMLKRQETRLRRLFPDAFAGSRLSKKRLAEIIFSSPGRRRRLEALVHPLVAEKILSLRKAAGKTGKIYVVEMPLLFEARMENFFDVIVTVRAARETCLKRSRLPRSEAIKRIAAQVPLGEKVKKADYVINNDKGIASLEKSVSVLWDKIMQKENNRGG